MFFVSEEFLRSYEAGGEVNQTIDAAVPEGQSLFEGEYKSKADARAEKRQGLDRPVPAPADSRPRPGEASRTVSRRLLTGVHAPGHAAPPAPPGPRNIGN